MVDNKTHRQEQPDEQRNRQPNHRPGEHKQEQERERQGQQPEPDPERGTAPGRAAVGGAVPVLAGRPYRALAIEQNELILFNCVSK